MRPSNILSFNAVNLATNQSAAAIPSAFVFEASMIAVVTGASPVGTLKLQASNDDVNPPHLPVNWVDIPSASAAVAATGNFIIPKTDICYKWIRLVWVSTSGTGAITANLQTIGA